MNLAPSELILNPDGSIYHLHLKPGDVATTIITVGDQDRVHEVSKYFDVIELKRQHREFLTHTGIMKGKRLSVISTGIGPDNIDIVMNELDALFNIDFAKRIPKSEHTTLQIIRLGTSGALQPEIPLNAFIASKYGIGLDNLLHFYEGLDLIAEKDFSQTFIEHTNWNVHNASPYAIQCDDHLLEQMVSDELIVGITTTHGGFYGPQGRSLRLPLFDNSLNDKIASFRFKGEQITNLEMETAAIYGMAKLLGHKALSLNVILANRATADFSNDPGKFIDALIQYALKRLTK